MVGKNLAVSHFTAGSPSCAPFKPFTAIIESFAGKDPQFETRHQETNDLPYDFHSIMHYSKTFFSKNNLPTIAARIDPEMNLGLKDSFSALDVVRVNMLYECPQLQTNCKYIHCF